MKKYSFLLLIAVCSLFCQCSSHSNIVVAPMTGTGSTTKVDYDQESINLMKELAPQIVGTWTLRQVQVKYQSYNRGQKLLNIKSDTTFFDLATLTIVPAAIPRSSPVDLRRGEYDGTLRYASKTYPIKFDMLANPDWIYTKKGSQTFFGFEYGFPDGIHQIETEEAFLRNIGLVGDNYQLQTTPGTPAMVWHGLNNGVDRIYFVKQ